MKTILTGRKTYIVAAALICLGGWMVLEGASAEGACVILSGLGFTSLGDRANRHQAEILQAIQDAGKIANDIRTDHSAPPSDVTAAVADALKLSQEFEEEYTPGTATGNMGGSSRPAMKSCGGMVAPGAETPAR